CESKPVMGGPGDKSPDLLSDEVEIDDVVLMNNLDDFVDLLPDSEENNDVEVAADTAGGPQPEEKTVKFADSAETISANGEVAREPLKMIIRVPRKPAKPAQPENPYAREYLRPRGARAK